MLPICDNKTLQWYSHILHAAISVLLQENLKYINNDNTWTNQEDVSGPWNKATYINYNKTSIYST